MARPGPPAYAWDWFSRQRLLWREARLRLAATASPVALRYAAVDTRADVVPMLRADYPRDDTVRRTVDAVVAEVAFLGRTDVAFATLGFRNPPRGLRWWWSAVTGEDLDVPSGATARPSPAPATDPEVHQLTFDQQLLDVQVALDEVHEGYGD